MSLINWQIYKFLMDTQDAIYDSEIITKSISQIVYNVRSIHFNSAENHNSFQHSNNTQQQYS